MFERVWTDQTIQRCQRETGVQFIREQESMLAVSRDFGGLQRSQALALARPTSSEQLQKLLQYANQHQLQLTVRALGLSQSGQALAPEKVIIVDLTALDNISDVTNDTIECGAGALWRSIIDKTAAQGLLPYVLPFNLSLTVGGILSAGGIGAGSFRHGMMASHVQALRVVKGNGEITWCNVDEHADLYQAVLAGIGQHAIISQVRLPLRTFKPRTRTFFLLYDDHHVWLKDQLQLAAQANCDYLEAICTPCLQGMRNETRGRVPFAEWFYVIHLTCEYDESEPKAEEVLSHLHFWRHLHTEDMTTLEFTARHDPRFVAMRQSGAWQQYHPWFECFLPYQAVDGCLDEFLEKIPLALGGFCHLFPLAQTSLPQYLKLPESEQVFVFTFLPPGVSDSLLDSTLKAISDLNQLVLEKGGKRYLSGWLGDMTQSKWQHHYGDLYERWVSLKQCFDPNHVLTSKLGETIFF